MLRYVDLGTNDLAAAGRFYDAVLAPLGWARTATQENDLGYAPAGDETVRLWVLTPWDRRAATAGNGTMLAFDAPSRAAVDAFHAAALAHGGSDEGAPGLRPYEPGFYACYVRDPDGNKLSAVHVGPE
jgi:catechol 2,3-dioxygenase-like lactoylglutathione lyase family enzyme